MVVYDITGPEVRVIDVGDAKFIHKCADCDLGKKGNCEVTGKPVNRDSIACNKFI